MARRLAAILAADVVGYSRLMGADEEGTLERLKAHRRELIDPKITEHRGRIVKTTGDGILIEFPSVLDAVRCAVEVQRAMIDRNAGEATDRRIEFRVGINLGDIIIDGDDILGDGVNVAARLEGFAEPGTVCISRAVFDQVRNRLPYGFEDLGDQQFKNIAELTHVFRVKPADAPVQQPGPTLAEMDLPVPKKPSIAIMPFTNLSGDPDKNYLSDGLRLGIQVALVHASGLFLIAPSAVAKYRNAGVSPDQVGREMGVRYVLEGAVQWSGRNVRINVELTDVETRHVIWAERYDRTLDDGFAVQDEITAEILKALGVKLAAGEDLGHRDLDSNLELVDRFYRGLSHFYAGTKDDNANARQIFEAVARLQPHSSIGPAYVCATYLLDVFRGWTESKDETLKQAARWAAKTLEIKTLSNGMAHIVLGFDDLLNRRHDAALANCAKAVELRPNCPIALSFFANILHFCGRPKEAITKIHEAIRVAPLYPPWFMIVLAAAYRDSGELEKSISAAKRAIQLNPIDRDARLILCSDHGFAGRPHEAQTLAQEVVAADSKFSVARYADSQPYKDAATLKRVIDSLREAGLPG